MSSDTPDPTSRRSFFQQAAARVVGPVADYLEQRLRTGSKSPLLRPPGAIDEPAFLDACQRCGACVTACPAVAIFALSETAGRAAGTPVIDADHAACVVCEGLQCTHVCPSGALLPLHDPSGIRMGTAEVYASLCVRTDGEDCTMCVERCPMGSTAIEFLNDGPPYVNESGCVGCGVCQFYCPTTPKAIVVKPR